jgi:hypothetical protein
MRIGDRGQQRTAANPGSQIRPNWKWLGPVGKATGIAKQYLFFANFDDWLSECGLRPRTAFAAIYGFCRVRDASVESVNWELHSMTCTQHVVDLASRFISRATQPAFRRSRRDQIPASRKNRPRSAAGINIIVQVVQRCSPGTGIVKHIIRATASVEIGSPRQLIAACNRGSQGASGKRDPRGPREIPDQRLTRARVEE